MLMWQYMLHPIFLINSYFHGFTLLFYFYFFYFSGTGEEYIMILGQYFLYANFLPYRILIFATGIDKQELKFHFKYKALIEPAYDLLSL